MKHYFIGFLLLFFNACTTNSEAGNGFVNLSEDKFHIGSNKTVELFTAFDKAWANKDYELLKTLISLDASFEFEDGKIANGADKFIEIIQKEAKKNEALGNSNSWTTEYAFSVDLNTNKDGEWVNSGFTQVLEVPKDGVIKKVYNEWYYFEKGKLEQWYQTVREVTE